MHAQTKPHLKISLILKYGVFSIIVLVPFYAFFTTWIGSNTGGLLFLRAWKELLLVVLGFLSLYLLVADKSLRKKFLTEKSVWLIGAFTLWIVATGLFLVRDHDAAALGVAIQLRSLIFFLIAGIVVFYHKIAEETLYKLVTLPAVGVVAFGLLQIFVLPYDFLKHFGYQKHVTIPPFFTIDEQVDRLRIFSTLRGPNPLGVYLIAPIVLVVSKIKKTVSKQKNVTRFLPFATIYLLLSITVLYGSHSRSAWLGLLAALGVFTWLLVSKKLKLLLVVVGLVVLSFGAAGVYQYRHTNFVQDVILHDNPEEGGEVSSNQGRIDAFSEAKDDIASAPIWGCGVGCAGPASFHHSSGQKISENFYIQTIQELGFVGLVLLMAIHGLVIFKLVKLRTSFSYAWVAIFAGISIASLLSHAWADDTITYIWWGVAGLILGGSHNQARREF